MSNDRTVSIANYLIGKMKIFLHFFIFLRIPDLNSPLELYIILFFYILVLHKLYVDFLNNLLLK